MLNISRKTAISLVFLVTFIPFVVSNSLLFPFIAGKAFAFRAIVFLLTITWLYLVSKDSSYLPKKNQILYSVSFFMLVILIANIAGLNPENSFYSRFERMDGYITLIYLFIYFIISGTILSTEKLWNRFWQTSLAVSALMSFYGVFQLLGFATIHQGGVRLDGTFGNASYLASYTIFHIFLGIFYLYKNYKDKVQASLYTVAVLLQLMTLYFTATRGAILGVIGGISLMFLLTSIFEKENKTLKKITVSSIAVIIIFIGIFISLRNSDFVKNSPVLSRFSNISLQDATVESRFLIWGIAIEGFKDDPLTGYGQGNFNYIFNEKYKPELYRQEPWFDSSHNVFLDWLITGGILGLVSYILIFFFALYSIWFKAKKWDVTQKSIMIGLISAYFINNIFVFDNTVSYILFFSVLSFIAFEAYNSEYIFKKKCGDRLKNTILISFAVLFIYFNYSVNIPAYRQSKVLIKAMPVIVIDTEGVPKSPYTNGVTQNYEYYKKALSYNTFGDTEVRQQLLTSIQTLIRSGYKGDILSSFVDLGTTEMFKQIEEDPKNALHYYVAAQYFAIVGDIDNALITVREGAKFSPMKQDFVILESKILLQSGKIDEALLKAKEAYEADKRNTVAWKYYITLASQTKNDKLFESLILESVESGLDDRVFAFINDSIVERPNDPQPMVSLAALYDMLGKKDDAIKVLEEAKVKFPALKSEIDGIIKSISSK